MVLLFAFCIFHLLTTIKGMQRCRKGTKVWYTGETVRPPCKREEFVTFQEIYSFHDLPTFTNKEEKWILDLEKITCHSKPTGEKNTTNRTHFARIYERKMNYFQKQSCYTWPWDFVIVLTLWGSLGIVSKLKS
jgi:hypothetical protein